MAENAPMDYQQVMYEFDNDHDFLIEVTMGFLENIEHQIETIRQAIADGDCKTIIFEAHTIKGGAANLIAMDLSEAAKQIELLGKTADMTRAPAVLNNLENETKRLKVYIGTLTAA